MHDVAADRVDVEGFGQRQLFFAGDVQGEHRVGARVAQHGGVVVSGQLHVLRLCAVAVDDGGNPALAPGSPGCALAGLGTDRDGQLVDCGLSHDVAPVWFGHGQDRDELVGLRR